MDFEKEPIDVEEEFEKPELTKGATRDTDPQYFTNIDGIYAKDAAGRAAVEELRTLVTEYIGDYSTTERKIGKWIDGSDLYQRTFEVSNLTNKAWNNSILGTSDIEIVDMAGYVDWTESGNFVLRVDINYYRGSSEYIAIVVNSTKADINIMPYVGGVDPDKAVITIKYTKPSVQALNANLIPSDNPFNVSVMESSGTPTSNEEPTDEMR